MPTHLPPRGRCCRGFAATLRQPSNSQASQQSAITSRHNTPIHRRLRRRYGYYGQYDVIHIRYASAAIGVREREVLRGIVMSHNVVSDYAAAYTHATVIRHATGYAE